MRVARALIALLAVASLARPARGAKPVCGNNIVERGEQCDGTADSGCPGHCRACKCPPVRTFTLPSAAKPPHSPGSPHVTVTNPNLIMQFGTSFSLNKARYTRFKPDAATGRPDAILILIPGFEGAAGNFRILAQNLMWRIQRDHNRRLEVWAFDRRTHLLEDTYGLEVAERRLDSQVGLNWLFGKELGLPRDPRFPLRHPHAVFYNPQDDIPFLANWTNLVFSQDIDAVVNAALKRARNRNVFLGGHSAGTGFTARYAATDFNLQDCSGATPQPGYAKLRGLVLLEGGGGSTGGAALTADSLDRMIAKFDGGLFGAVRDNAPRCVDGTTPCTVATEATDCAGQTPAKCTPPTTSYALVPGILNPRILASSEPGAIQGVVDPNTNQILGQVLDIQGKVPDLHSLSAIPAATVEGSFGTFLDKDGLIASTFAPFVAMSLGQPGPVVGGILTWTDILHGPLTAEPDEGAPPTTLSTPLPHWGTDTEDTRLDRVFWSFFAGRTNFSDWYYPNAGPSTTSVSGVCTSGTCTAGNVGATCSANTDCSQVVNLDSTLLSAPVPAGRGRCDIENLRHAADINIPVIGFCGSDGLATVPGAYTAFAQSIGPCTAPSCTASTPRVVDASTPSAAFPTFGGVAGGFETYVSQGFAHLDVLNAEDNAENNVVGPLSDFIDRNIQ